MGDLEAMGGMASFEAFEGMVVTVVVGVGGFGLESFALVVFVCLFVCLLALFLVVIVDFFGDCFFV